MRRRFLSNINKSIPNDYHSEYFAIEALEDGLTAKLSRNACEYCIDNGSWNTLSADTNTPSINKGQTLSFRGNLTPNSSFGIGTFTISKKCNLEGNIMSLLYGDNFEGQNDLSGKNYVLYNLFKNCTTLQNAENLILPATTLANSCYYYMFRSCTSLTTAPQLLATTLASNCYRNMFYNCTSLKTAPELPATTLANYCYSNMFESCTNLTTAPKLPATTLASYCYLGMFAACTSLTTAPKLPATTLASSCYGGMFRSCTSLTKAPELPATTLASGCYSNMFGGTNVLPDCSNIDFSSESIVASGGLQGLFNGTKVTDVDLERILPKNNKGKYCLPVTTLRNYCYSNMFANCTSLTTAPELPATTLANYCYDSMFANCSNLNYIKMLATDISASGCLNYWVNGVASSGTFVKNPQMNSLQIGSNGIPNGWSVYDNVTLLDCISLEIIADDVSGRKTNTTIYYTAQVNAVDEDENKLVVTKTGTAISEEFPQNTSETESIDRTIIFTYMGVTATTTITQGVWVNESYTITLNDQWQLSDKPNPDSTLYDGVYESFSNKGINSKAAVMYIDISGYTKFDLYIRSYAESSYDYVMVSQLDQTINNNTSYSNSTLVKAHTRGSQISDTDISHYTHVQFTEIDGGEHRITIVYRKDSSGNKYDDRGYVLILKK